MCRGIRQRIRLFWRDRRAVSAIEFAMIAPIIVMLMLGAYDLGNAAQQQIALQQAVRTGGQYAMHFPTYLKPLQSVVQDALPTGLTLKAPPVATCSCGGVGYDCSTPPLTCTPPMPMLVTITAQMDYNALTPIGAALPRTFTATYVTRFK
jgi:Flp pilus assembly protein TadG